MEKKRVSEPLSLESPVEEVLRFLFASSLRHVFLKGTQGSSLLGKEELISFMETKDCSIKIEEILTQPSKHSQNAFSRVQKLNPSEKILFLKPTESSVIKAEDVSYQKGVSLPSWWDAPFPLLTVMEGKIVLNKKAQELWDNIEDTLTEKLPSLPDKDVILSCTGPSGTEYQLFSKQISPAIFFIEDISDEVPIAQNMAWWAGIGKTLTTFLEAEGVQITSSKKKKKLKGKGHLLPCRWEEELLGYINLLFEESTLGKK